MSSKRSFRKPKSYAEEEKFIKDHQPKSTQYVTKWAVKIFEEWQRERTQKEPTVKDMPQGKVIQNLTTNIIEMSAETLNFWLVKFVSEVCKPNGERYPARTLHSIISGLQRYLHEKNGEEAISLLSNEEKRLVRFRKALDAEMKQATFAGIGNMFQRQERKEISEEEETALWRQNLLGCSSAKTLVNTIYFYNGKLFGIRAKEHRNLRIQNFKLESGAIIYKEGVSKTFHGGLKDLKYKPREVRHVCCTYAKKNHYPCIYECFAKYFAIVDTSANEIGALYLKPNPNPNVFSFHKAPLGINSLNRILPDLCAGGGLERKTSHSLRITTASRLFNNSVDEKLIRERTGHRSNALFSYEKNSAAQEMEVSKVLGPSPLEMPNFEISDDMFSNVEDEVSDEVLSKIPIPMEKPLGSNSFLDLSKAVFNNCSIHFTQK